MSQEDTTKHKPKPKPKPNPRPINNYYYYHNSNNNSNNDNNHNAMKYENKRSAAAVDGPAALYENFIPSDNNNKHPNFAVEREPNKSAPFNNEQRFVHNTTSTIVDEHLVPEKQQRYVKDKLIPDYENLNFNRHLELDKKVLLQKYFRTALVGPRTNIYENLCRGCNYGVFTARGPLCSFCECIVNGVSSISASPAESSNNIYENICANCAQFYSGNEEDCQCRKKKELVVSFRETEKEVEQKKSSSLKKVGSEDCLSAVAKEQKVKVRKSKSFSKTTKPKILTNFWDTLRKNKTPTAVKKPLEIVHNVEGYDQVFHTKESFDLQRICELKRSATSCSDQHIYGRLKQTDLVRSQEDFLSTQSLTHSEQLGKKRHVSKPKFLRSLSANSPPPGTPPKCNSTVPSLAASTTALQAVYLNNSVCQWMTSLRHDFNSHCVNTCILNLTDEECDCECYPKSIPAKKLLLNLASCKTAPSHNGVTNRENIYKNLTKPTNVAKQSPSTAVSVSTLPSPSSSLSLSLSRQSRESVTDTDSLDSAEIVALRRHTTRDSSGDSLEGQTTNLQQQQQQQQQQFFLPTDHYQQMVDEFKFHLVNKQVKQKQQQLLRLTNNEHIVNNNTMASAGVNNSNSNNNGTTSKSNHSANADIPLRQAVSNHNKAKRQGMYLRLGEQHNLQSNNSDSEPLDLPQPGKVLNNDDHNNNNNDNHKQSNNSEREHLNHVLNSTLVNNNELELSTVKSFDSDSKSATPESHDHEFVSRALSKQVNTSHSTAKRGGIHERNILQAFEALLRKEQQQQPTKVEQTDAEESQTKDNNNAPQLEVAQATGGRVLQPLVANTDKQHTPESYYCSPVFDLLDLINRLQLSCSLNTAVIHYDNNDKQLFVFLRYISQNGEKYKHATHGQLVRKYQRFHKYLYSSTTPATITTTTTTTPPTTAKTLTTLKHFASATKANSVDLKLDLMKTNGSLYGRIVVRSSGIPNNDSFNDRNASVLLSEIPPTTTTVGQNNDKKPKKPPEVPKRDPSTKLSPTTEQLPPIPAQRSNCNMTVPSSNLTKEAKSEKSHGIEESIYQPIWKCKTVGEVQERFKTDADYYTINDLQGERCDLSSKGQEADDVPEIFISEEDHSEWEPDEEFVFATQLTAAQRTQSLTSHDNNATIRSNRSNVSNASNASSIGSTSLTGSTITDFASSTATLASCVSSSLMHHLFRNIGIFYSLSDKNVHAIIYDYDRIHSSKYFAKKPLNSIAPAADDINDSGLGKSPTPSALSQNHHKQHRSPVPLQRQQNRENPAKCSESVTDKTASVAKVVGAGVTAAATAAAAVAVADSPAQFVAPNSSVLAWKHQLLNVNYMEDEEDMLVSESEILRAQKFKEDLEHQPTQPQQFIQRFKSRSTDNILDLPIEDDKKTITERVRSRLQRGILNINNKSSPKSEKKLYKALRNSQTTSLYLEDGLKPKNPIFAAPLDQLELNQTTCPNVPRFVADSIEYIERKDRIVQDGLYRACGNKFTIDELKQKLTKSYIYDPKLIAADDIHTITSLLKQFFRDLPQPLIPQETYNRLARDLLKIHEGIDSFRIAVNEMPEPNKSTLAFLIKHLTNVAACSASNRMNASNLAIVWGPSLFTLNEAKTYDIGRMNTLAKVLIQNYDRIFHTNERLL